VKTNPTFLLASLQIPYLLNIALAVTAYLSAFPPDPSPTFALLRKLDYAFASLLQGADIESGEALPGFEAGKRAGLSKTDMVRCKSLVETTRVQIVDIMSQGRRAYDQSQSGTGDEDEMDTNTDESSRRRESPWDDDDDDGNEGRNMDIAIVYEKTIVQLGDALGTNITSDTATGD
jgi:Subunit 11 of the general transcription factor TFIIH